MAKTALGMRALLASAFLSLFIASTQADDHIKVIGYLTPAGQPMLRDTVFKRELETLGWREGKNIRIDYARAGNDPRRLRALADQLVRKKVDLILAQATPAVKAAMEATSTIPIVSLSADPVTNRFVASLGRPGGNVTGISMMMPQLAGKRLELLRELLPKLSRVGFLGHGADPSHKIFAREAAEAGQRLGIPVRSYIVQSLDELDGAFAAMKADEIQALIVQPLFVNSLGAGPAIVQKAAALDLPATSDGDGFADMGGLLFYGPDPLTAYKRLALYADRILKGGKPSEMPMEQPETFLMVVNLATAKKLGINVPNATLMRAERVVQ